MNAYVMNGTNRALPMNEPVTIIMASIAAANAIGNIIARRRQTKKEKAEAHTAFMHEVYKIPGLTNADHKMLHEMAERNLNEAARWVDNYLAAKIVEAENEQKKAQEEAEKAQTNQTSSLFKKVAPTTRNNTAVENNTDNMIANYTTQGNTKEGKTSWWKTKSDTEKAMIIGGGVIVAGTIAYLLSKKRRKRK
jgi:hypothetical protein